MPNGNELAKKKNKLKKLLKDVTDLECEIATLEDEIQSHGNKVKIICYVCNGKKLALSGYGMSGKNKKCHKCKGKGYLWVKEYK